MARLLAQAWLEAGLRGKALDAALYVLGRWPHPQVWEQAAAAMQRLKVPQARIDQLLKQRNPALVAELVKELEGAG